MQKIISLILSHPKKTLFFSYLIVILSTPFILKVGIDFGVEIWFSKDHQELKNFERFKDTFGSDNYVFLALDNKDTIFNKKVLADIKLIHEDLYSIAKVNKVQSLANLKDIRKVDDELSVDPFIENEIKDLSGFAKDNNLMEGLYLNKDQTSAHFLITLDRPDEDQITYGKTIRGVNELIKKYPYDFKMVGTAAVVDSLKNICFDDLILIIPVLSILIFIILYFIFKDVFLIFLVFQVIILTNVATFIIAGILNLELNNLSSMVSAVLMAISIADAIHFLSSFELSDKENVIDASKHSFQKNFFSTLLTTLTTSLGFLSLTTSNLVPIYQFGILCSVGTLLAWIFSVTTIFPSLILKRNKKVRKKKARKFSFPVSFIMNYHKAILVFSILLGVTCSYVALGLQVNSNPFNYFSKNRKINKDNSYFNKEYGGFSSFEILMDSKKVDGVYEKDFLLKGKSLIDYIHSTFNPNHISSVHSYITALFNSDGNPGLFPDSSNQTAQYLLLYSMSLSEDQDLNNLVDIKNQFLRTSVFWDVQDSTRIMNNIELVRKKAQEIGLSINITGREYLFNSMNDEVVYSFLKSIFITVFLISILLIVLFKSFSLGIMSLIPNILPLVIGASIMSFLRIPLDVGSVLVMSVCFGIAVDDTIHFLKAFNQTKGLDSLEDRLRETMNHVGHALISTTVVLGLSFCAFLLADFTPNFNFGVFTALILMMALITDLLVLPSLLVFVNNIRGNEKS